MRIIDISMPIHLGMPVYNNREEKKPKFTITRNFENDSGVRETKIELDLHTGTHMDAPLHMIKEGQDSSFFRAEDMIAPCRVLDLTNVEDGIIKEDLVKHGIKQGDFVILKTRNSFAEDFEPDFVYVKESGAKYLVSIGVTGVGIDSLGIERSQPDHVTHRLLLGNGIHILEGLRLKDVEEGNYTLVAVPLSIRDVEASPVRALLLKE
ncbi:MAG: cyclase family protein [Caldicoprobacterales bacterium]|nr:cyclase family protein [Clostridiales bacterium]